MKKKRKLKKGVKRILWLFVLIATGIIVYDNYHVFEKYITDFVDNKQFEKIKFASNLEEINATGDEISDQDVSSLEDSGIKGSSFIPNAIMYPYFEMLNENEKSLYRQTYENALNLSTTFVPNATVNSDEVMRVIEALYDDHPELFWVDTNYLYKYTTDGKVVQIILTFNNTISDINTAKAKFEASSNEIISGASSLGSIYEKEKYVHDKLIDSTSYNVNAKLNQSAYSALVNKVSVCAGYARAFQYIMMRLGVPVYYVTGEATGNHAWNMIILDNACYNVDLTWDDDNNNRYSFFNLPDNPFYTTHTKTGLSKNLPSCNATTYTGLENKKEVPPEKIEIPQQPSEPTESTEEKTEPTPTEEITPTEKTTEEVQN